MSFERKNLKSESGVKPEPISRSDEQLREQSKQEKGEQNSGSENEPDFESRPEERCREYAETAAKFSDKERAWIDEFIENVHKEKRANVRVDGQPVNVHENQYDDMKAIKTAIKKASRPELLQSIHPDRFMDSEEFDKIETNGEKIERASKEFQKLLSENQEDIVKYAEARSNWEKEKHHHLEMLMKESGSEECERARIAFMHLETELVKAKIGVANKKPQGMPKHAWKGIGKGWRWLGDQNLSNTRLFGRFRNSEGKFGKVMRWLGGAASLRTAAGVLIAKAGIEFVIGFGVPAAVGTSFVVNRGKNKLQKRSLFKNFKEEIKNFKNNEVTKMTAEKKPDFKKVLEMYREIAEFVEKQNNKNLLKSKEYHEAQKDYIAALEHWMEQKHQEGTEFVAKHIFGEIYHMDREAQKKAEKTVRRMTKERRLYTIGWGIAGSVVPSFFHPF